MFFLSLTDECSQKSPSMSPGKAVYGVAQNLTLDPADCQYRRDPWRSDGLNNLPKSRIYDVDPRYPIVSRAPVPFI